MKISKLLTSITTQNPFVASPNHFANLEEEMEEYVWAYGYQLHSSLNSIKDPFPYFDIDFPWWLHLPCPQSVSNAEPIHLPQLDPDGYHNYREHCQKATPNHSA